MGGGSSLRAAEADVAAAAEAEGTGVDAGSGSGRGGRWPLAKAGWMGAGVGCEVLMGVRSTDTLGSFSGAMASRGRPGDALARPTDRSELALLGRALGGR